MNVETKKFLQRGNSQTKAKVPPVDEKFGCPLCHAQYAIVRRQMPPGIIQTCESCDEEFPAKKDGEWLLYEPET
jgi:hypothetical protein